MGVDERFDAAARGERRLARQQRLLVANARPGSPIWVKLCELVRPKSKLFMIVRHCFEKAKKPRFKNLDIIRMFSSIFFIFVKVVSLLAISIFGKFTTFK